VENDLRPPSFADVLAARDFLATYLQPTPLIRREALDRALGLEVWLKCESLLPTAAFKVRGGLNLIGRDPSAKAGVIAASTGNHGQSLAYAGGVFEVPVTIVVPTGANPIKLAAMRAHGATIVEHGTRYCGVREAHTPSSRAQHGCASTCIRGTSPTSSRASRRRRSRC
jgi:threonine dehydratase